LAIAASRVTLLPLVAQPGGAVDEQRAGVDGGRHLGELGLGQRQVGEGLAEHRPGRRAPQRLVEGAAGEAERGGGDRGAEDVEGAHRHLEALAIGTDAVGLRHPAAVEAKASQRMRRDHLDARGDLEAGMPSSTMKAEMPLAPFEAGSLRAKTM
jgi:hypothetical protein